MRARPLWWSATVGAVVILAAALVVLVVPAPVPQGREFLGRVVGGDEILRGPDLLRVQVDRADGADPPLRVPVDDLLPVGTEVRLRLTPDGEARLSGPDAAGTPERPQGRRHRRRHRRAHDPRLAAAGPGRPTQGGRHRNRRSG